MREIKFRAWTEDHIMHEPLTIEDIAKLGHGFSKNVKLLQYIGLKDRNNKEIFDGDILQDPYTKRNMVVCWIDVGMWGLKIHSRNKTWSDIGWVDGKSFYEIIGNIYQNPDLLPLASEGKGRV